ncbi:MAG TPA: PKD domain-containing protein [Mycobacteriales bacterium]|nr:PKD domain-containing protein [Mycobacteriales bacterium]
MFRRQLDRATGVPIGGWERLDSVCLGADTPLPIPATARLPGLVRREFKADAVVKTTGSYQPRDGGVVNLETIFYADTPRTITLAPLRILGFDVAITATATNYHWTWGDGSSLDTASPGTPYPDHDVTHVYRRPGSYRVHVTVTYTGTYSVDGGATAPIVGTVTVPGPGVDITVREARAELVEGDEPS